jgi:hypothetical protein
MVQRQIARFAPDEWKHRVLTPVSREARAAAVRTTHGRVQGAEHLLAPDEAAARLEYPAGGEKPWLVLDLGPASPGGYPVFYVKSVVGRPVLRISYADLYDHIVDPVYGEQGDFGRGTCKYLGVELPVPPANPYRYELYTITGPGQYAFPLIQGQQRWVRIQLETEGTSVELSRFHLRDNVTDRSPHDGFFLCSDEDLNLLWYASTYTAQMASLAHSNAWDTVDGWLAPRGLAKSNDVGLSKAGAEWSDYRFEFEFRIMKNPGPVSAAGWVVRAQDEDNGYVFRIDLDSRLHVKLRRDGVYRYLKEPVVLPAAIVDGEVHRIRAEAEGDEIRTYLDGQLIDLTRDGTYRTGRVGFCQPLDKWAWFRAVRVTDFAGVTLLEDDFRDDLSAWSFRRTLSFVADGVKRDRLPWIGDLDWAGRNIYYAFRDPKYMADSLRMIAFNQTPEGYIWATCYPENTVKPRIGEYGYYQSDIFSAWFLPTLADYVLFTGDRALAAELFEAARMDADYLWSYVEGDGLFFQRYNTSKGLWSHELETVGKFAYNNILICDALNEFAFIAEFLGETELAAENRRRAAIMQEAILRHFWDDDKGCFVSEPGRGEPCFQANVLALAIRFLDEEKAERAARYVSETGYMHGKVVSLGIRGCYEYGFDDLAIRRLRNPMANVNWLDALKDENSPCTTWECMIYPQGPAHGANWGDFSHPDTAMAHILTGYMLGIQPREPGFVRYAFVPHPSGLSWAKGVVPVPGGREIRCGWQLSDDGRLFEAYLDTPEGLEATVAVPLPDQGMPWAIALNGKTVYEADSGFREGVRGRTDRKYIYIEGLPPGTYEIVREAR